jgi:uncharacterized phage protein (predicted DNA packaging)
MADLAAAKAFCRVDHSEDDTVIAAMIAAASDHLARIGVDMDADPLPSSVDLAVLMLTAFFYDHRDDSDAKPQGVVDRLIQPYREVHL